MNSEYLIPCGKENGGGVLKIKRELPQLFFRWTLDIRKQTEFFLLITKMDKPSPTLTWLVECLSRALVFCCPPNRRKHRPTLPSTLGHLLPPHRCSLSPIPCLLHDQGYQQGRQAHWLLDQGHPCPSFWVSQNA